MAITQADIDALETELKANIQSIKDGDQLLWYKKNQELIEALQYLRNQKNVADSTTAAAPGGGRFSLADFS